MATTEIKKGQAGVFAQLARDGEILRLGTAVEPIRLVETGTLRGSAHISRKPFTFTVKIAQEVAASMKQMDIAMGNFMARLKQQERANDSFVMMVSQLGRIAEHIERRRLWPRYAAALTLFVMAVAIWI